MQIDIFHITYILNILHKQIYMYKYNVNEYITYFFLILILFNILNKFNHILNKTFTE